MKRKPELSVISCNLPQIPGARTIDAPIHQPPKSEQLWVPLTRNKDAEIASEDLYPRPHDPRFANGRRHTVFLGTHVEIDLSLPYQEIVPNITYSYDNCIPRFAWAAAYQQLGTEQTAAYAECALRIARANPGLTLTHITTGINPTTRLPLLGLGYALG